jgi:hypothetical protein
MIFFSLQSILLSIGGMIFANLNYSLYTWICYLQALWITYGNLSQVILVIIIFSGIKNLIKNKGFGEFLLILICKYFFKKGLYCLLVVTQITFKIKN